MGAVMGAVYRGRSAIAISSRGLHRRPRDTRSSFNPRDRACKILRRERREVVDTFAHPDEMYRQAVFRRNGKQDATARGAVELGHDKTADAGDVAKHIKLGQRIPTH